MIRDICTTHHLLRSVNKFPTVIAISEKVYLPSPQNGLTLAVLTHAWSYSVHTICILQWCNDNDESYMYVSVPLASCRLLKEEELSCFHPLQHNSHWRYGKPLIFPSHGELLKSVSWVLVPSFRSVLYTKPFFANSKHIATGKVVSLFKSDSIYKNEFPLWLPCFIVCFDFGTKNANKISVKHN